MYILRVFEIFLFSLIDIFIAINFPLSTALAASNKLCYGVFPFFFQYIFYVTYDFISDSVVMQECAI